MELSWIIESLKLKFSIELISAFSIPSSICPRIFVVNFSKRSIPGLDADRLARLKLQASLQLQARNNPDEDPPYLVLDPEEPDLAGLEGLPKRNKGDVFLDYEGHPFWTPKEGLFFLFGFLHKGKLGRWEYQQHWAHDKVGEAKAAGELVDYLHKRLKEHPKMHVYHYNHTEVSELEKMEDVESC